MRIDSAEPAPDGCKFLGAEESKETESYWQLTDRRQLNPGSPGDPLYLIELRSCGPLPAWRAGDLVVIRPRLPLRRVAQWLKQRGLDGAVWVTQGGCCRTLADWLSERRLPETSVDPVALRAGAFTNWPLLPERYYSVASRPEEGRLILLVRQRRDVDGRLGLGSGWLTAECTPGDFISARIRANSRCHTPDHRRPILLIGAGSGLAGLRAQLSERALCDAPGETWLIYGERCPKMDRHLESELEQWMTQSVLSRCDRIFSRGGEERRYVQDILTANAEAVCAFLSRGADIYVCGNREGMGDAVHRALEGILGTEAVEQLIDGGRYRRDLY